MALGSIEQQQLSRFFEIINSSKLNSELVELTVITSDNQYLVIQQGTNDALKVSVPKLRGVLGNYDAATNTPTLSNGTALEGDSYRVSVAGTRDFGSGSVKMNVEDTIFYRGGIWRVQGAGISTNYIKIEGNVFEYRPIIGNNGSSFVIGDLALNGWISQNSFGKILSYNGGNAALFSGWDVIESIG